MSTAQLRTSRPKERTRLLQVVESLNTGAVENWLYRMFSAASVSYPQYHWTFFCTLGKPGRLDERVRRLGGEIIHSPCELGKKRAFFTNLRRVIRAGNYDVLHSHHDFVSAVYLCASIGIPIRKRIVHVHNTDEGLPTAGAAKRLLLKEPMRQTCIRLADNVVGISNETLARFSGKVSPRAARDRVIYYGIDTQPFRQSVCTREQFRLNLGFPADAKILLFVGRMVELKNPVFVVEVLTELLKINPNAVAVFAGAGPLESNVRELARHNKIADRVKVMGWRDDTATMMRLSDALVFPRLEEPKEGLGLVLVEAQAAGLPIVASPSITEDVKMFPELFEIVSLSAGAQSWAEAIADRLSRPGPDQGELLKRIESSQFGLRQSLASLMALYEGL
jgi:glycosyltransferase involved in cell wall biosynthesis